MKAILSSIILILAYELTEQSKAETALEEFVKCEPDWSKSCKADIDCCSDFCDKDPNWKLGVCKPSCGKSSNPSASSSDISHERQAKYGEFPWYAAIYRWINGSWTVDCGGTLISRKVVVSSATCFVKPGSRNKENKAYMEDASNYKVELGKYYKAFSASEDVYAQTADIQSVEIPRTYLGEVNYFASNIAFLKLKTDIEYSRLVRPICVDIGKDNFEKQQLTIGQTGKIVGWGIKSRQTVEDRLIVAELPFVPLEKCKEEGTFNILLNGDVICAGNKSSSVSLCGMNIGGGFTFQDLETKRYYLRGVLGISTTSCLEKEFDYFTKLSVHEELVEKYLRLSIED